MHGSASWIEIGASRIGRGHPTYIIAEIGINHNGDTERARRLIRAAADARADAVKFQKRRLSHLYPRDLVERPSRYEQHFQYLLPILKQVELPEEAIRELKQEAEGQGLDFLCTPFDEPSFLFLEQLGVAAYKIASADLVHLPFIERVARAGKPMILSTGMSTPAEIRRAVETMRKSGVPFALLHCRSVYPVKPWEVQLSAMSDLARFGCPVGYSSHDEGILIPVVAVAMGASILEKHLTLDRSLPGPDHRASLEPKEFRKMVEQIRTAEQAMGGSGPPRPLQGELLNRDLFRKSIVAARPLQPGERITREAVRFRGPGRGLPPYRLPDLLGRRVQRRLKPDEPILESDLETPERPFSTSFKSAWGLPVRFPDLDAMLQYEPKTVEFHLAEQDLEASFHPPRPYPQRLVVHVPEYLGHRLLDLCSPKEDLRRLSVRQVLKTLDLTRKWSVQFAGKPKLVVHAGAMARHGGADTGLLRDRLLRSWEEIRCDDVEILMENLPPYPWYFGGQWVGLYFLDAYQVRDFCETTGAGFCLDLCHAFLYCNARGYALTEYIRTIRPYIRHIHFADAYGVDGEGVQIGEGEIDFDAVMPLLGGYRGTWIPEIWQGHLHGGEGFREALRRLARYDL